MSALAGPELGLTADARELEKLTKELLLRAGALGRLPTPVDDIVAAAKLREPSESVLSDAAFARAPQYIRAAIAPFRHKIRALLDRREREIHLDPKIEIPGKQRFNRLHEMVHHGAPWQRDLVVADTDRDLSPATRRTFEREAKQGSAMLLFQHDLLRKIRATLRGYAGPHRSPLLGLALDASPMSRAPLSYRRNEAIASGAWIQRYGVPSWPVLLVERDCPWLRTISRATVGEPVEESTSMPDLDGRSRGIVLSALNTSHQVLVLLREGTR
jgi:hypothetical protein